MRDGQWVTIKGRPYGEQPIATCHFVNLTMLKYIRTRRDDQGTLRLNLPRIYRRGRRKKKNPPPKKGEAEWANEPS